MFESCNTLYVFIESWFQKPDFTLLKQAKCYIGDLIDGRR